MLNLSAAAIIEKNKLVSDSVWIILLEIATPDDTIRIASNNTNVEWGGYVWTAFPFIIDDMKYDKEELIEVPVRISNVTKFMEYFVEYYDGLINCEVVLRVVNSNFLDEENPELEENFVITSTTTDSSWCTFKLGSGFPLRQRFPKDRLLKDFCPFIYKGVECGSTSSEPDCPRTLYGCYQRNNMSRFGGEPAMLIGGMYSDIKGTVTHNVMHSESTEPIIHHGDIIYPDDDNDNTSDSDNEDEDDAI